MPPASRLFPAATVSASASFFASLNAVPPSKASEAAVTAASVMFPARSVHESSVQSGASFLSGSFAFPTPSKVSAKSGEARPRSGAAGRGATESSTSANDTFTSKTPCPVSRARSNRFRRDRPAPAQAPANASTTMQSASSARCPTRTFSSRSVWINAIRASCSSRSLNMGRSFRNNGGADASMPPPASIIRNDSFSARASSSRLTRLWAAIRASATADAARSTQASRTCDALSRAADCRFSNVLRSTGRDNETRDASRRFSFGGVRARPINGLPAAGSDRTNGSDAPISAAAPMAFKAYFCVLAVGHRCMYSRCAPRSKMASGSSKFGGSSSKSRSTGSFSSFCGESALAASSSPARAPPVRSKRSTLRASTDADLTRSNGPQSDTRANRHRLWNESRRRSYLFRVLNVRHRRKQRSSRAYRNSFKDARSVRNADASQAQSDRTVASPGRGSNWTSADGVML